MNKTKQSLLAVVIGLTLAAGVSYGWTAPTANPPGGNTLAPINISDTPQTKTGNLIISGFTDLLTTVLSGNVTVGTETVNKNLDVKGMLKVLVGATVAIVTDDSGNVAIGENMTTTGTKLDVAGKINTQSLTVNGTLKIPTGAYAGYYLTSDANGVASWKMSSGMEVYDIPGDYIFTVPLGITSVRLKMVGGGGGGASGGGGYGDDENFWWGAGGGGAGFFEGVYEPVVGGQNIVVTVGAGGAGGAAIDGKHMGKDGYSGGDSWFGTKKVFGGGEGTRHCTAGPGGAGDSGAGQDGDNGWNYYDNKAGCIEGTIIEDIGNGGDSHYGIGGTVGIYGGDYYNNGDPGGPGSNGSGGGGGAIGFGWLDGYSWKDKNSGAGGKGGNGFVEVSWGY